MYMLTEGSARVVHRRDGQEFELAILKVGDFFGELALVDSGPRSADVETLTPCTMLRIEHGALRALSGVYPGAAFKLLIAVGRALVQRMRRGNQKYIDSLLAGTEHDK
jgi:CRP-like cAMP-binding protein